MPPDGVGVVCRDLLDEAALQQALEHVANGTALDVGGDREDKVIVIVIVTGAGAGQDGGLSLGKLDLMHGGSPGLGRHADRASPTTRSTRLPRARAIIRRPVAPLIPTSWTL